MNYSVISERRSEIMLLSILWVIAFHFTPPHNLNLVKSFFAMGYGGVDFFMFLSGFGLFSTYYNLNDFSILKFYKKRFYRIIPTYFTCILIFGLIRNVSCKEILWQLSCVGFWIGKPNYDWYIQAALVLYFLFPFVIASAKRIGVGKTVVIGCFIGLILTSILIYLWKGSVILFTSRIPVFFIGCYFGYLLCVKSEIKHCWFIVSISLIALLAEWYLTYTIESIFLFRSALSTLPFILIVPGICILLAKSFDYLSKALILPIKFLGSMTLEIYLCHMSMRFIYPESKYILPILAGIVLHYFIKYATYGITTINKLFLKTQP